MDFEPKMRARLGPALDALIVAAAPYEGLFPSLLDRRSGRIPEALPPPIPGQRNGDRAYPGSNLIHDEATLKTLYALARAWNRPDYAAAANRYLQRFAIHCTDTATGLFPWGEHSFWHLVEDRVGNSYVHDARYATMGQHLPATHDHLRQAPLWLWEKLWEFNPDCVERFAEGLDFHWQEGKREEYIRHATIESRVHPTPGGRSCDFPRHGGFFIFDWAFAWSRTGREDFLQQIRDMLDYWWLKRDARGLLLIESRCPPGNDPDFSGVNAPGQTLSLAASLLEAAELLAAGHPALANTMRNRAAVYVDGFLAAPHDLEQGVFVISSRQSDNSVVKAMPIWGSEYGVWPASYIALTCLCVHRLTGDPRLLAWACAVGECYRARAIPVGTAIPAMDAGLGLGLLADLYDITGDTTWLTSAAELAKQLVSIYFDDAPLPCGAASVDWYESQMGPGFLLHGLARTALLGQDRQDCPLAADYTAR